MSALEHTCLASVVILRRKPLASCRYVECHALQSYQRAQYLHNLGKSSPYDNLLGHDQVVPHHQTSGLVPIGSVSSRSAVGWQRNTNNASRW
eukprot:7483196-Pyramimonas_sp.AAC.1